MDSIKKSDLKRIAETSSPWQHGGEQWLLDLPASERDEFAGILQRIPTSHKREDTLPEIISGPNGSGKTTLLMHLARSLLASKTFSPDKLIYVPMREMFFRGRNLKELVSILIQFAEASHASPLMLLVDEITCAEGWELMLADYVANPDDWPVIIAATAVSCFDEENWEIEIKDRQWNQTFLFPGLLSESRRLAGKPTELPDYLKGKTLLETLLAIPNGTKTTVSEKRKLEWYAAFGGYTPTLSSGSTAALEKHYQLMRQRVTETLQVDVARNVHYGKALLLPSLLRLLSGFADTGKSRHAIAEEIGVAPLTLDKFLATLRDAMLILEIAHFEPEGKPKFYFWDNSVPASLWYHNKQSIARSKSPWIITNLVASALKQHSLLSPGVELWHAGDKSKDNVFVLKEPGKRGKSMLMEIALTHKCDTKYLLKTAKKHPELANKVYIVSPDAEASHKGEVGKLSLRDLLLAVEYHKQQLLGF